MTYYNKIWLIITKRSYHSIYLFLLVFAFSILGIAGYYFSFIIENYHEMIVQDVGYSIGIYRTDDQSISDELFEKISHIEEVERKNIEAECLVYPLNFCNVIQDDSSDVFSPIKSEYCRLLGNFDTAGNIVFKKNMILISGAFPSDECNGAIIDSFLAEQNGLTIGDDLHILGMNDKTVNIPVIGIYHVKSYPQESQLRDGGYTEYGQSPYSYIFCDLSSYELASGSNTSATCILYAQDKQDLEKVYEELISMGLPEDNYLLVDRTEGPITNGTTAFRAINAASEILISISIVITSAVLFFVIIVWIHACYKDIAVLISLGMARSRIIILVFGIVTLIAVAAVISATPICLAVISNYRGDLLEYVFVASGILTELEMDDYLLKAMTQPMGLSTCIRANLIYIFIAWVATCVAALEISLRNVKILFDTK